VASGICVVVHGPRQIERPYGVFTAHAASPRAFSRDDVHFLESAANVVAAAIVRTRAETQLRVAEREVQHERDRSFEAHVALQQRDDFISVAAHELRTPLTALQLKLQGLDRATKKGAIDSACKSLLEARLDGALRQTARLADLVERLLDVSRIAGGRLEMHIEDTDLARIVARVIEDFGPSAAKAGSELRLAVRGPARGAWDRTRIEQVVVNLISNAIKYGAGKAIDIEVGGDARSVTLSVSDRGIGISDDDTRRIFERFERAVPMRYYGGLGLGLYVARQIVEAHGGTVKVSSCAGRGSTFLIDLPVAPRRA